MTKHKLIILALALLTVVFAAGSSTAQSPTMLLAQAAAAQPMTYADLERLYLDGKISAKQYQRLLNEMKSRPAPPPATATKGAVQGTAAPVQTNRPPVLNNSDDKINQVENKMDELIKARAAREKATNTPPKATAGPKTKRERMNDLLRLYIEGKITEPELNERRAKIMAEPEP